MYIRYHQSRAAAAAATVSEIRHSACVCSKHAAISTRSRLCTSLPLACVTSMSCVPSTNTLSKCNDACYNWFHKTMNAQCMRSVRTGSGRYASTHALLYFECDVILARLSLSTADRANYVNDKLPISTRLTGKCEVGDSLCIPDCCVEK